MHPHLADVFQQLDASRAALRAAVAAVPPAARDRKPAGGGWSVNEVLEHLALAGERFAGSVAEAIEKARQAGLGPEQGARVPLDAAIRARVADRGEKRQAPENMLPAGRLDADAALAAMERAHDAFRRALAAADGLALSTVVADHRRWGPLTAYQWAEVFALHEQRHAAQIVGLAAERV